MDIISYSMAKKYSNMVALGLASATVDDVNKSITFTLASDGSQHTIHFNQPSDGQDGLSVTDIDVNANNQIVFTMSDGTEFISGKIPTVKGDKGDAFTYSDFTTEQLDALKGTDGYTPVKGTDYWTADDKAEIQSYIDNQIGGALNGSY